MRLLYYCPFSYGGLADYAHEQASALARAGIGVKFLCPRGWRPGPAQLRYAAVEILRGRQPNARFNSRFTSRLEFAFSTFINVGRVSAFLSQHKLRHSLFATYSEYLAPLWAWKLEQLADRGVVFGAIVHDPVRDYIVGPRWWHRLSIAKGYSFLREAFVHDEIALDTGHRMAKLRITTIPHGPYPFPPASDSRSVVRKELSIPEAAKVMLAFGQIRDAKNLDLVIRAVAEEPDFFLLVVGNDATSGQKSATLYQNLAQSCGVADRCRWKIGFVPAEQIGNLFEASDLIVLTYSARFRSASGVLNTAVRFRRPCLASGGQGGLRSMVQRYRLGVWVEPDRVETIKHGIETWLKGIPDPLWKDYEQDNSWTKNAELVVSRMFSKTDFQRSSENSLNPATSPPTAARLA